MHEGQTDLRRAEIETREKSPMIRLCRDALQMMTYRGIVEDKRGGRIDRWCTGVCGRIDILPCVEL
jgi:hypothetical protein